MIPRHCGFGFGFVFLGNSQGEIKRGAFIEFGFDPNPAAMFLNDALDSSQSHARAFKIFRTVQSLKRTEELLGIFHVEADAVVAHEYRGSSVLILLSDFNHRLPARAGELDGVR